MGPEMDASDLMNQRDQKTAWEGFGDGLTQAVEMAVTSFLALVSCASAMYLRTTGVSVATNIASTAKITMISIRVKPWQSAGRFPPRTLLSFIYISSLRFQAFTESDGAATKVTIRVL